MSELASMTCEPCRGGVPPMAPDEIAALKPQVPRWQVIDNHHLRRFLRFDDFATGLAFVNAIGAEAEAQGHHPDILLAWGKVEVTIWTHKVDGLTQADFILAARIDRLADGAAGLLPG